MQSEAPELPANFLAYDGSCPACSSYARWTRLLQEHGPVALLDIRQTPAVLQHFRELGLDADEGMLLRFKGRHYYGDECVTALALMSSDSGILRKLNRVILGRQRLARILYPVMAAGRRVLLWLIGVPPIKPSPKLYRRQIYTAVAFVLLSYSVVAGMGWARRAEFFPFFYWSLYTSPKATYVNFAVRVLMIDGKPVEPPQYLDQSGGLVLQGFSGTHKKALRKWGAGIESGSPRGAQALRANIETLFEGRQPVRYQLVRRTYDLRGGGSGRLAAEDVLGEYEYRP